MARIAGVNLPTNKRAHIALTYIHGIGRASAKDILHKIGVTPKHADDYPRINEMSEEDLTKVRDIIDTDYEVEGDKRRTVSLAIKRLLDMASYRGLRHRKGFLFADKTQKTTHAHAKALPLRLPVRKNRGFESWLNQQQLPA